MPSRAAQELADLLERDLDALVGELEAYTSDSALWRLREGIANSGGTLAIHMAGNLQHFVGAVLGGTGYERDRPGEFGDRDLPRGEVLRRVAEAREVATRVVAGLEDADLDAAYPARAPASLGERPSTRKVILHLIGHLMYHLGQLNYHRRLLAVG